jgi:hypothetical protein
MRRTIAAFFVLFSLIAHAQDRSRPSVDANSLLQGIDAKRSTYADIAKQIWAFA